MWYGHIPLVRHLKVFGSTCYALIPKEYRSNLDARSRKCIFLGYSNTTKGYHIYDKTNNKFIISKDVIFLESSKKDEIIERKLDHLDRFTRVKTYHEFDDDIPHIEGGNPILGKYLEYPFEAPPSPHEEVHATSSEPKVHLDGVIKRFKNRGLMRTRHHLNQLRKLDHLINIHQNGSQNHLKVFILMRSKDRNQNILKTRWR
jgi:adenylate kinase family enzyme